MLASSRRLFSFSGRLYHASVNRFGAVVQNVPALGESITEGTIAKWLKGPGDHVDANEVIPFGILTPI